MGEGNCVLVGLGEEGCVLGNLVGEGDCEVGALMEPVRKSPPELGDLRSPNPDERPEGGCVVKRLIEPVRESPPVLGNLW